MPRLFGFDVKGGKTIGAKKLKNPRGGSLKGIVSGVKSYRENVGRARQRVDVAIEHTTNRKLVRARKSFKSQKSFPHAYSFERY